MKRGVWFAALALGLGGVVPAGRTQETVWRATVRPVPPAAAATVRARAGVQHRATLGRPVAHGLSSVTPSTPRPFPAAYQAVGGSSRTYSGIEPIATVAPPGAVIAASAPASVPWTGSIEEPPEQFSSDLFASDRLARPIARPSILPATGTASEPQRLLNWQGTFNLAPPVEEPAATPAVREAAFGADLPPTKWYARAEYLLWWTKNDTAPPLVSTGTPQSANDTNVGSIGRPDTIVLFGGELDRNPFSGGRFTFGYYFDDCGEKALEVSGFFLGQSSSTFETNGFQTPVITRPFFAANPGIGETTQLVSFPGRALGSIRVDAPSDLWGIEANLLCQWCCGCNWRVDPLVGFRYLNLRESISINEAVLVSPTLLNDPNDPNSGLSPLAGATANGNDRFATRNQFYGGQVGLEGRWQRDRWTLDGRAKLGLGVTHQTLEVTGSQSILFRNTMTPVNFVGGLLALNSNIGRFNREEFAVVPELGITAGYYLTDRLRALVGYNVLYWSSVARPGDQIDRVLDINRIPNFITGGVVIPPAMETRPARLFNTTDFWAQGLTLGLEYRY